VYFDVPTDEEYRGSGLLGYLSNFLDGDTEKARYDLAGEVLIGSSMVAFKYNTYDLDGQSVAGPRPGAEFWLLRGDKVARVDDYYETRSALVPETPGVRSPASAGKYVKSGLSEATTAQYRTRLVELMDEENVYLQPDLSLPQLAGMVRCSVNHLSQVINAEFGASFFEFLNQYRIADAKTILASDPKCHALDVALRVGFNSNSTFYSAFKKICHVTPAQFRRQAHGL
jgi:AraC-like DNA-binding protein